MQAVQLHLRVCELCVLPPQASAGRAVMAVSAVDKQHPAHLDLEGLYLVLRIGVVVHRTLCLCDYVDCDTLTTLAVGPAETAVHRGSSHTADPAVAACRDRLSWNERFNFALPTAVLPVPATSVVELGCGRPMHAPHNNDVNSGGDGRAVSILATPCVKPGTCSPPLPRYHGGGGTANEMPSPREPQAAASYLLADNDPSSSSPGRVIDGPPLELELWSSRTLAERCIARAVLPLPASLLPATAPRGCGGPQRHTTTRYGPVREQLIALNSIDEVRSGVVAAGASSGQTCLAVRVRLQVIGSPPPQGSPSHAHHPALLQRPDAIVAATASGTSPGPGLTTLYPGPPSAMSHTNGPQPHYLLPTPTAMDGVVAHTGYSVFPSPRAHGVLPPPPSVPRPPDGQSWPSYGDSLLPPPPSPPRM